MNKISEILHSLHYDWLLALSGTSWVGWLYLKAISKLAALMLPITGVFSFILFVVINFKKIREGIKEIKEQFKKK